ncbi:MAG: LysR family transcriptional regulator [Pseudomonadota bacterium]
MAIRRIPSLNWLRVFDAAARAESFARAAVELNMSAAAVSQQIKALEGHLGRRLFVRHARHVRLTDAGHAFLPVVRQSLGSVETTAAALFGSRDSAPLVVQASLILACGWLASRLSSFRTDHPDIQLNLMTGNDPADFRRTDTDWQIHFGGPADMPEGSEWLMGECLRPVATPEIAAKIRSPNDVLDHPLIEVSTHRPGWLQMLADHIARDLSEASITFADNTVLALGMAAGGFGIAIARGPVTDGLVEGSRLTICDAVPPVESGQGYFLVPGGLSAEKPAARAFRDWLMQETQAARATTPLSLPRQSG